MFRYGGPCPLRAWSQRRPVGPDRSVYAREGTIRGQDGLPVISACLTGRRTYGWPERGLADDPRADAQ